MSLIRWTGKQQGDDLDFSESPLGKFRSELDRLFTRFFEGPKEFAQEGIQSLTGWGPSVDVSETETAVTIKAELPGIAADDINVTLSGQTLTISGEKKSTTEAEEENWIRSERRFGSFRRSITLPTSVDVENVSAKHENGVLIIQLNKVEGAVPKKIAIQGGENA